MIAVLIIFTLVKDILICLDASITTPELSHRFQKQSFTPAMRFKIFEIIHKYIMRKFSSRDFKKYVCWFDFAAYLVQNC